MKRILTLIVTLMLLLSTALADAPAYSPEVTALKTANALMYEKYGFTWRTLGVLTTQITSAPDSTVVTYRSYLLPASRVGEYTVTITGDQVTITWSHDAQVASLTADPDCPIWGHAQVQTYFDQGIIARDSWVENYISPLQEFLDVPDVYAGLDAVFQPVADRDIPKEQLRQTAKTALADVFDMTPEAIDAMYIEAEQTILQCANGHEYWFLRSGDVDYFFTMLIDRESGELFRILLFSGGLG